MNKKSAAVMNWRNRTKWKLITYKGGKCQKCGYDKPIPGVYHFHHEDPLKKDFAVSGKSWNFERLKAEVDKCTLYCANCHAEVHWELQDETRKGRLHFFKSRTPVPKSKKCSCGKVFKPWNNKHRFCSDECAKVNQRKVDRPSKEMLKQELSAMNWSAVGRKYGVSDNAVRKWAKAYDI